MTKATRATRSEGSQRAIRRRKNDYAKRTRAAISGSEMQRIGPPQVLGPPLNDPTYLTFEKFLRLPQTQELFGMSGDAAQLLASLTKERAFVLARANTLSKKAQRTKWREMLAQYVRRAYLGDVRGLLYWRRVAKVIWVAYENMLRLKVSAALTRDGEIARIARWEARAEKERARQKARRARAKGTLPSRG